MFLAHTLYYHRMILILIIFLCALSWTKRFFSTYHALVFLWYNSLPRDMLNVYNTFFIAFSVNYVTTTLTMQSCAHHAHANKHACASPSCVILKDATHSTS